MSYRSLILISFQLDLLIIILVKIQNSFVYQYRGNTYKPRYSYKVYLRRHRVVKYRTEESKKPR